MLAIGGGLLTVIAVLSLDVRRSVESNVVATPDTALWDRVASPREESAARRPMTFEASFLDNFREGYAAYQQGRFEKALESYQQAVARNPTDADALNNLAQVLARLGRPIEALQFLDRAVHLNGSKWAFRFNRAHAYGQLNDWSRAAKEYHAAATLFPNDYATQYNLGLALHKRGDEAAAVPAFLRAIELAPQEASFYLSLGVSDERVGQWREALNAYRRYLDLAPEAPNRSHVLAKISELAGPVGPSGRIPAGQVESGPSSDRP